MAGGFFSDCRWIRVTALVLGLSATPAFAQPSIHQDDRLEGAYKFKKNGWTYVHLQGSPGQIGYQHGYLLAAQIEDAYRLAYGRRPDGSEKDTVFTFLTKQQSLIEERASSGQKLALPTTMPAGYDAAHGAALVDFCQMLLNSNEFVYRN